MTYLVVIAGLVLLVFLHELGHFWVARVVGMRPRSFYIGFPPPLVKVKRKGIEYGIGMIPLGGLVKLPGMNRPAARDLRLFVEPAVREEPSLVPAVGALRRALETEDYEAARRAGAELEQEVSAAQLTPRARRSAERALREVEEGTSPEAYWRGATQATYVWGLDYPDALIARDHVTNGRQYAQHDANYNVTSIATTGGAVQERYVLEPYGTFSVKDASWVNRGSSLYAWVYLHQGGRYDSGTGLYDFRERPYSPTLGRWVQQDSRYVDGLNLYEAYGSGPTVRVDPHGEQKWYRGWGRTIGMALGYYDGGSAVRSGAIQGAIEGSYAGLDGLIPFYDPFADAGYYDSEFQAGRTLVTVQADGRGQEASDIMQRYGALDRRAGVP